MGAEVARQFKFVDAVVSGEGDIVFPEIVRRVMAGESCSGDSRAEDHHTQIDQEALNSQFTDWTKHKLVTLPELRRTTRGTTTDHDQYQRIKALCDPGKEFIRLNEKFKHPTSVLNVFVLIITSNEDRPVTLPMDDRRMWVLRVETPPGWDAPRYRALAEWYDQIHTRLGFTHAHLVVEWLRRRWDAKTMAGRMTGHAPHTPGRAELIIQSRSDVEDWILDLLNAAPTAPLHLGQVFTSQTVMDKLESAVRIGGYGLPKNCPIPGAKGVGRILGQLGCVSLNSRQAVPMPDGTERRAWARRGDMSQTWSEADISAWFAANPTS